MAWSWYAMTRTPKALRNALMASVNAKAGVAWVPSGDAGDRSPLLLEESSDRTCLLLTTSAEARDQISSRICDVEIELLTMSQALKVAAKHRANYICLDPGTDHGAMVPVALLADLDQGGTLVEENGAVCLTPSGVFDWVERDASETPTWIRLWLIQYLDAVADLERAWLLNSREGDRAGCELVIDFAWDIPDEVRQDRAIRLVAELSRSGVIAKIPGWLGVSYLFMQDYRDPHPLQDVPALFAPRQ